MVPIFHRILLLSYFPVMLLKSAVIRMMGHHLFWYIILIIFFCKGIIPEADKICNDDIDNNRNGKVDGQTCL